MLRLTTTSGEGEVSVITTRIRRACFAVLVLLLCVNGPHLRAANGPAPLLASGHPVDWWFVFKFNASAFAGCGGSGAYPRQCPFGGDVQPYNFGQQFVYASQEAPTLQRGQGCVGETVTDPVGATFDQIYNNSSLFYVIWNDQFYDDPDITGCGEACKSPWGHSKGMLVWNSDGEGFVMQVTTPSWPAAGNRNNPRRNDGNTLGCVIDNNVKVSQHAFALKLSQNDVVSILNGLKNASIVTDPTNRQIVRNGGPSAIMALVSGLGSRVKTSQATVATLSTGVRLISKPSRLHVPPWQMVSALLGGVSLRTATWWAKPQIFSTITSTKIACWDDSLGSPGAVRIALTGQWEGQSIGLRGGLGTDRNHAKIGVSTSGGQRLAIFGDLNQQGLISGSNCASSQNGRGGLFYVVQNAEIADSIAALIDGDTAPTRARR